MAALVMAVPVAAASPPPHPGQTIRHATTKKLNRTRRFTIHGLPARAQICVDEAVDGNFYGISTFVAGPKTFWFFGRGVSGRLTFYGRTMIVEAANFRPRPVNLTIRWWLADAGQCW